MPRQPNRYGGGAQTNINGLTFERTTSLNTSLESLGFTINNHVVIFENQRIGLSVPQHKFYSVFLNAHGIDYSSINSKKWLPDEAFVNERNRTVYIIEKKFQKSSGSVDEKLPNCHFKLKEYKKLCNPIGYHVKFIYILSDWFNALQYADILTYIEEVECSYYFNELPLHAIGL